MMIWEKILVVQGKELLERNSCGVVCNSDKKNIVYILGGKDNSKELTNSIIECDIKKRTAKKMAETRLQRSMNLLFGRLQEILRESLILTLVNCMLLDTRDLFGQ